MGTSSHFISSPVVEDPPGPARGLRRGDRRGALRSGGAAPPQPSAPPSLAPNITKLHPELTLLAEPPIPSRTDHDDQACTLRAAPAPRQVAALRESPAAEWVSWCTPAGLQAGAIFLALAQPFAKAGDKCWTLSPMVYKCKNAVLFIFTRREFCPQSDLFLAPVLHQKLVCGVCLA